MPIPSVRPPPRIVRTCVGCLAGRCIPLHPRRMKSRRLVIGRPDLAIVGIKTDSPVDFLQTGHWGPSEADACSPGTSDLMQDVARQMLDNNLYFNHNPPHPIRWGVFVYNRCYAVSRRSIPRLIMKGYETIEGRPSFCNKKHKSDTQR